MIEKLKFMATTDKIALQRKGKDHEEIDFFGKIILNSNNEESFVYASSDDIRYWVRKVPVPVKENVTLLKDLIDEIPTFLNYLNSRKITTSYESRMWFRKDLLVTDALKRLISNSMPTIEKEIRNGIKRMFIDFGQDPLLLPIDYITRTILERGFKENYVRDTLEKKMNIPRYKNTLGNYDSCKVTIPEYDTEGQIIKREIRCRPYIFNRADFFTAEELKQYESFKENSESENNEITEDHLPF